MKRYDIKHLPIKSLFEAAKETTIELNGVIKALGGTYPPPNPKTVVTYQNGDVAEYLIEGEIGSNSIPNKNNAVKVDIGTAVTSIGRIVFFGCSNLTSITIPDSVTNIGDCVFHSCSMLTSVSIGNGLTNIGDSMFTSCHKLTSITIPDSVTSIGNWAFQGCSGLTSVTIGNGVTSIGGHTFNGCTALSNITSFRTSAPTVQSNTFGYSNSNYTGRNTYSSGNNVLKVPQGAAGYETTGTAWKDALLNSGTCGFHIEYI